MSLRMVGCGPSLKILSFLLLPLINISQASLMTRIGLRLGGKHNSVSHQVLKLLLEEKISWQNFPPRWEHTAAECPGLFGFRGRRSRRNGERR